MVDTIAESIIGVSWDAGKSAEVGNLKQETPTGQEADFLFARRFNRLNTGFQNLRLSIRSAFDKIKGFPDMGREGKDLQKQEAELDFLTAQTAHGLDVSMDGTYVTIRRLDKEAESTLSLDPLTRDVDTLWPIAEKGAEGKDFLTVINGESDYPSLPLTVEQPDLLTAHLLDLQKYSQANDNEIQSGVYSDSQTGYLEVLTYPVLGSYNHIDKCYESGGLPVIKGATAKADIHAHPSHEKERKQLGVAFEDLLLSDNFQSEHDIGMFLTKSKLNPVVNDTQTAIVVGRDLAVMLCKTKQTPTREHMEKQASYGNGFVETVNKAYKTSADIKAAHPDWPPFSQAMLRTASVCKDYNVGLYMLRLRGPLDTSNTWTRFSPAPDHMDKAIGNLLQPGH